MAESGPDCGCTHSHVGHPVVVWQGWGTNDARNNGADIYTMPIQPQHYSNFTATQTQLFNGLQHSNFGRRASYDHYLRMVQSSASNAGSKNQKQLFKGFQPAGTPQPSTVQLQQYIQNGAPTPSATGGTGIITPSAGFDINARRYYG